MKDEIIMELEKHVIELTRRVMALEAWKAEMLKHTINVMMTPPSKVERDQPREYYLPKGIGFLPTTDSQPIGYDQRPLALDREDQIHAKYPIGGHLVADAVKAVKTTTSPDGKYFIHSVSIDDLTTSQPEINWEKVAIEMYYVESEYPKPSWSALTDYQRGLYIKDARAAVAEYLRQVKEGGK